MGINHDSPPVAEFTIPQPWQAFRKIPNLVSEPLPATKTNGDLSVTLTKVKSGLSRRNSSLPASSNRAFS